MAKLGEVEFSAITEETPRHDATITDKPVERGANVSDHARPQPWTLQIRGQVTGSGAAHRFALLQEYWRGSERLRYVGRTVGGNLLIESLSSEHDARVADGFRFDMTLKQIRIARVETIEIVAPDPAPDPDTVPSPAEEDGTASQVKDAEYGGGQHSSTFPADVEQRGKLLHYKKDWFSDLFDRTDLGREGRWGPS